MINNFFWLLGLFYLNLIAGAFFYELVPEIIEIIDWIIGYING